MLLLLRNHGGTSVPPPWAYPLAGYREPLPVRSRDPRADNYLEPSPVAARDPRAGIYTEPEPARWEQRD